jgi:hypothetical protein
LSLPSPTESARPDRCRRIDSSSPRVWSPSATSAPEARLTRVYLARHLPTPGFRTLLPVSFFQNLPAVFHAGNALGVLLQGLFPSQSLQSLSALVPFVALAVAWEVFQEILKLNRSRSASPSRLYSLRGFDTRCAGLSQHMRPLPSWTSDLEGFPPSDRSAACATESPHELRRDPGIR